jgi:RNA polymerase sigma-B factor
MAREELEAAVRSYRENGTEAALERVIRAGEGLVIHFAGLYSRGCIDEDLKQAGYEGLLKALRRFEPAKNVLFATYAAHCIMGEIRRELKRRRAFRVPEWLSELQAAIVGATEELIREKGAEPGLKEIAERINITEAGIVEAMQAGAVSLEQIDISRLRSLRYESFKLPLEDQIAVRMALERLDELPRKVLTLTFYQDLTQEQVAQKLGLNQRKVSRLLGKGLTAMRAYVV